MQGARLSVTTGMCITTTSTFIGTITLVHFGESSYNVQPRSLFLMKKFTQVSH